MTQLNYYEVEPEDSKFYTIGVDITHRCNMSCANCYSPIRHLPDVDRSDVIKFFKRLGRKTEIRFTGGEPTLRDDLPLLIEEAVKAGHRASIMTNGLRLADPAYCSELKKAGLKFVCISLNGADDDEVYKKMDSSACAHQKVKALENIAQEGFFININCIIAKGVNEHVPARLNELLKKYQVHGVLRFRNIGELGRYMKGDNYSFDELISLVSHQFGRNDAFVKKYTQVNGYEEEHNVLFPLEDGKRFNTTWVKITDWRPIEGFIPDPNSIRRGRMTKTFKVAPFFEHSKLNGY